MSRAKADSGRDGLTIKLKRTDLDYTNEIFSDGQDSETLNYGEPLYFNNDKTMAIGDGSSTNVQNLKVFKAVDHDKADLIAIASSSDISQFKDTNNNNIFAKDKVWPDITISSTDEFKNITTNATISDNESPCYIDKTVSGMKSEFNPICSLKLSDNDVKNASTVKTNKKAFGLISKGTTSTDNIRFFFIKKPQTSFTVEIIGG